MVGRRFFVLALSACVGWVGPAALSVAYYPTMGYPPSGIMPAAYCPCTPVVPVTYACPTPAPPSPGAANLTTNEPPIGKQRPQGPIINQYRTFGGVPQVTEARTPNCKVSFWNLTGFDVNLTVGERTQTLAKDRAVVLDLNRNFSWRINNEQAKTEDVPDDMNHFEVLVK